MNKRSTYRRAMSATPATEFERRFFMYLASAGQAATKHKKAGR
jgi:hypothetical protein